MALFTFLLGWACMGYAAYRSLRSLPLGPTIYFAVLGMADIFVSLAAFKR